MSYVLYFLTIFGFSIYSYALVDPNLTLFNHPLWTQFRESLIYLGYYQRSTSWNIYLAFVIILFVFHFFYIRFYKSVRLKFLLPILSIFFLSYPFLSHDVFNYMFDARIFTYYHQNPYVHTALNFPQDDWLRFMHWIHRPYPYGPSFIAITLIPSFFSFGKFILNFILFKGMFITFYLLACYFLQKKDKKLAVIFATHPLILIEGLINTHNDLITLSLGISGIWFFLQKKEVISRIFFLVSIGIKYISFPLIFFIRQKPITIFISFLIQLGVLVYLSFFVGIQPWYFLTLFMYLFFFQRFLQRISIFFAGLLFSYYPYIALGGWNKKEFVELKETIILWSFIINLIFLFCIYLRDYRKGNFSINEFWSAKEHI